MINMKNTLKRSFLIFTDIHRKSGNRLKTVAEILNLDSFNAESKEYDMENEPDYVEIKRNH